MAYRTPLEERYSNVRSERGKKTPRGWDATTIAEEFRITTKAFETRLTGHGPFYPDTRRKLLPEPETVRKARDISSGLELAALLADRPRFKVDRRPSLDFQYVDREIVAARALTAAGKATYQGAAPVKLDLLLVNANVDDRTPIACEVKVRRDKDPEAALLQALLYASLLSPKAQRERLPQNYPDLFRDGVPKKIDVYVALHQLPDDLRPMLDSALGLARDLVADGTIKKYLRQIVVIDAYTRNGRVRFRVIGEPSRC